MRTTIHYLLIKRNSALICLFDAKIGAWVHCYQFVHPFAALKLKSMRFAAQVAESCKKRFNKDGTAGNRSAVAQKRTFGAGSAAFRHTRAQLCAFLSL